MRTWLVFLSIVISAVLCVPTAWADDIEIYKSQIEDVQPNVMILFDSSGSMLTILPVSAYDSDVDHSTPLLGTGKAIVFALEKNYAYPTHHRVTYQSAQGRVLLKYVKVTDGTIQSGIPWEEQWSDADGYFYFDREDGRFLTKAEWDSSSDSDWIKIFLPYATYSINVDSTGDYVTRYDFDYMNWLFYESTQADRDELKAQFDDPAKRDLLTRVLVAKQVIKDLVDKDMPIRYGLMKFNGSVGAEVVRNIPSDVSSIHAALDSLWVGGSTPLAESMEDVWDYFGNATSMPVDAWCRENYVIVMTDGLPQNDADNLNPEMKQDFDGDHGGGSEENEFAGLGSGYMDDIAWYMERNDSRPNEDGWQNVTTHTIGFTVKNQLLEDTAKNGGGRYYTAYTAQELKRAFMAVVAGILAETSSYAAPVVPISHMEKTTSGNDLYVALFRPEPIGIWRGNIKKYGLDSDGGVVDALGNPATDSMGVILDSAQSYWSAAPDGPDADRGGVGQVLLDRSAPREIYTYLGATSQLADSQNAFVKTNPVLTKDLFGVLTNKDRDDLIDFVYGYDAYDEDEDGDQTEKRDWILGMILHSRPVVLSYENLRVVFSGSCDGMLHAFEDEQGMELWAFVPPDLLDDLKKLKDGGASYFVDGSPQAVIVDNDGDGLVEQTLGDRAIIVFGERRGGMAYHALDVTDPYAPEMLWSIEAGDLGFEELGQTWSEPMVVTLPTTQVALAFGGGYDPDRDLDNEVDDVGRGVFIVDPFNGELIWRWTAAQDPRMTACIPSAMTPLDSKDSGTIDRLYVGDLNGLVWRFDLTGTDPSLWEGYPIFDSGGRKVFYSPDILQEVGYDVLVWGTGDRAHPNSRDVVDRIYMFKDAGDGVMYTEADLVDMTHDVFNDPSASDEDRRLVQEQLSNAKGWFLPLQAKGEKALAPIVTVFGVSYATTFSPTNVVGDPCSTAEGIGRLYVLHYKTSAAVRDMDDDPEAISDQFEEIGASIPSGVQIVVLRGKLLGFVGVSGGVYKADIGDTEGIVRIYWRQLF